MPTRWPVAVVLVGAAMPVSDALMEIRTLAGAAANVGLVLLLPGSAAAVLRLLYLGSNYSAVNAFDVVWA